MTFNWLDIFILALLFFSLISGLKKNLIRGILNLLLASILITFILMCLDSVILPPFLTIRLKESFLAEKLLRFFHLIWG